jgi:hypothetical protein
MQPPGVSLWENVTVTIPAKAERLRDQVFGAVVMILLQTGLGTFVNLFVSIPRHHAGSQPTDFFGGSWRSVIWAIGHGAIALVIHTVLGLLLAIMVIGIIARAISIGRRSVTLWATLGALFTIGAGFNGASFLDYNKDVSSFLMTILALASLLCFVIVIYLPWDSEPPVSSASATV